MHFSQQNAEATGFPDGHFDLVVGTAMLHETSTKAIAAVLRENHRLLAPGGLSAALRGPRRGNRIGDFAAAVHDWDTHFNAEPFIGKMHDLDPKTLDRRRRALTPENYIDTHVPSGLRGHHGQASPAISGCSAARK